MNDCCFLAGSFVELTSSHEGLRMFARIRMDWSTNAMVLTLKVQSMLEEMLPTFVVRVQLKGPASWVGLNSWTVSNLAGFVTTTKDLRLQLSASGTILLQPSVSYRHVLGFRTSNNGNMLNRLKVAVMALFVLSSCWLHRHVIRAGRIDLFFVKWFFVDDCRQ